MQVENVFSRNLLMKQIKNKSDAILDTETPPPTHTKETNKHQV